MVREKRHKQDWDDLAELDPLWAILSSSERQHGKWDIGDFFLTGEKEIRKLMGYALQKGYIKEQKTVLDFGCGVGRLTRALSAYFSECYGVDISGKMVAKARELNSDKPSCKFLSNSEEHLHIFPDNRFNLIYTSLVLQHIPEQTTIASYIAEFVRVLKPSGLLVFQLPSSVSITARIQPRRRLYSTLRELGFKAEFLYGQLGLHPIRYTTLAENDVIAVLARNDARILEVQSNKVGAVQNSVYYVTK